MGVDEVTQLLFIVLSGLGLNLLGKIIVDHWRLPQLLWWVVILVPFFVVECVMAEASVFERMVGLCVILLLGMKVIVYMEWVRNGGKKMRVTQWICFAWLWFGMEPRAFIGRAEKRRSREHFLWGLGCIFSGAFLLTLCSWFQIWLLPLVFIALSMMFHFGVLRLLTGFWAWRGMKVRVLFRNPLVISGFRDFWAARWNLAYSHMMARTVQRPLKKILGEKGSVFGVFLVSGFFHELAITVPASSGYGQPMLFFILQGCAVLLEGKGCTWGRWLCLTSLVVGLPVLFPQGFTEGVIWPVFEQWIEWTKL